MDGVEAVQHARVESGRRVEKLVVDLYDVQPGQESSGPGERRGTLTTDGARDLDPGEA